MMDTYSVNTLTPSGMAADGDLLSIFPCSFVAVIRDVPEINREAGQRSCDRVIAEEIGRLPTDLISDRLYANALTMRNKRLCKDILSDRACFTAKNMIVPGDLQYGGTAQGVLCLTLRENTERPISLEQHRNIFVERKCNTNSAGAKSVLYDRGKWGQLLEHWDKDTGERTVSDLFQWLTQSQTGVALKSTGT